MALRKKSASRGANEAGLVKSAHPTLRQVAERVGVTAATVSYVLAGRAQELRISTECERHVRKIAAELGYHGNYHARALSLGRSLTLGLAVGSGPISVLENPFWSRIAAGIESAARSRGYDLLLIGGLESLEPLIRAVRHQRERRIDALIVLRNLYHTLPPELVTPDFPAVVIGDQPGTYRAAVRFDPAPGLEQAVAHLATAGHRHLLWLSVQTGAADTLSADRLMVVDNAARGRGMTLREVQIDGHPDDSLASLAKCIPEAGLGLPGGPTAAICLNDRLALVLCTWLAVRGRTVPGHASVIGFDDLWGVDAETPLTTISHSLPAIGHAAVELAVQIAQGLDGGTPQLTCVPSTLVVRTTSGPVRQD